MNARRLGVKAAGPNLAGTGIVAGMRIHVPNHLKKDLDILLALSYQMKQKNPELKRNVKMDDANLGLVLDFCVGGGSWKRVRPEEARKAKLNQPAVGATKEVVSEKLEELLDRGNLATGANQV